jgi:2,4-dienoyl-CoA reductase-like NADH-dependent reductase (Old Yellow Enzyme family)/thioredoxin reductase
MSSPKFPHLFSPITIKSTTFKNRILVSPMGIEEHGEAGIMSERAAQYYDEVARGGCARVCSGENDVIFGSAVHGMYDFFVEQPGEKFKASIRRYVDVCHKHNALAFTSFGYMGVYGRNYPAIFGNNDLEALRQMNRGRLVDKVPTDAKGAPYKLPARAYGPSTLIIAEPYDGLTVRDKYTPSNDGKVIEGMTEEMMNKLADSFAHCAGVAREVGLDGIILHSGHGFMFSQWVSRRFNKRADRYGGSMENRARFPIMCLQRIRKAAGNDLIIEMRFSGEENISPITDRKYFEDMLTIEETVAFFKELDKYPGLLDIAHITGGAHALPVLNVRTTANSYFPMGLNVEAAAAVKKAVKNIKVGVVGSLSDPQLCENIVASGQADFVIMARQLLIADPAFPNKASAGEDEKINSCLRCVICRANGFCAINPVDLMLGDCDKLHIKKTGNPGKVVVVGGGIGGMKAAEYAAEAGHSVILFEKEARLGGILRYTDNERFKSDIQRFKNNLETRIKKMGVDIRLNTAATPELAKIESPDAVIVAVGGQHATLPVPGANGPNVIDSISSYLYPEKVGKTVAIIGGGLTGCEAAIHWADLGRKVILISRSPELFRKVHPRGPADGSVNTELIWLDRLKVEIHKGCACTEITPHGVRVAGREGQIFIPADTVINAAGINADPERASAFNGTAPVVKAIGDCVNAGLIGDAVLAAHNVIVNL